jgi:hypothetical protein
MITSAVGLKFLRSTALSTDAGQGILTVQATEAVLFLDQVTIARPFIGESAACLLSTIETLISIIGNATARGPAGTTGALQPRCQTF